MQNVFKKIKYSLSLDQKNPIFVRQSFLTTKSNIMDLSRKHHYQNLLNQEVDYIKTFVKGKRVQDARNPLQVWDHGTVYSNQISIINCLNYAKIIFLKDNVAEWMIFGIMADSYTCTSFEHFDHLLEHDFEQVHKACIDLYYSEIATNNFRQSLQSTYKPVCSFRIVGSEPVGVDPFSDDVPSATPSDFAPCGGCSKQQAPCRTPNCRFNK